ncbi:MAG: hypothetical protein QXX85_06140 [Candidatus Nitrosotenuis sp.]
MQKKLAILAALVLSIGLVSSAYAHKSEVVGNYKIEVGWKNEPPIAGKKNAIEIIVTKATASDKKSSHDHGSHNTKKKPTKTFYDETSQNIKFMSTKDKKHDHDVKKTTKKVTGITGLSKTLEVVVTLNGKKTFLNLVEDKKNKGTYYGEYTPDSEGFPTVHVVGKIKNTPIEITFHPEKVVKQ